MANIGDKAVMDFGSSKISMLVGGRGVNNTFQIKAAGEVLYDGFGGGEFYNPDKLARSVATVLNDVQSVLGAPVTELTVGVPGEFTTTSCKEVEMPLDRRRKITNADVEALYQKGETFEHNRDYVVVCRKPIYYTIDDDVRLMSPEGNSAAKLSGFLCYLFAERKFITLVSNILSDLGVKEVHFVPSLLAESLFLFEPEARDSYELLVDVGFITTNVVIVRGDGLLYTKTISLGGGYISMDLQQVFGISFQEAEVLKNMVVLSLDTEKQPVYILRLKDSVKEFDAAQVHKVVQARLEQMAGYVNRALQHCEHTYPDKLTLHLAGGGISFMRGAKEYWAYLLKRPVEIAHSEVPQVSKPHLVSLYGLLDYVLNQEKEEPTEGFVTKILKWFTKK
ncbi:MAG: hypothetical protein IJF71_04330 [Clostridia bacterium]|nr:hypothetical protein [Clostridia bacterium]